VKDPELIVVGAGPGGIAAAVEAARAGATVTILDENSKAGGRIFGQLNDGFKLKNTRFLGPDYEKGRALLAEFDDLEGKIEYRQDTLVFGIFENRVIAFCQGETGHSLTFNKLIVAAGAYDRPVPFPGWTLPGVMTAGGAQSLVKLQRVLPGKRILFAGTGPLQMVVANQVLDSGGTIEAVLEAGHIDNWIQLIRGFSRNRGVLADGLHYIRGIRKAGVPILRRHIIAEAHGNGRVEEAVIAGVDKDWSVIENTRRTLKVDTICLGYGLVPSTELTRLAGCALRYEPYLGGWIPERNGDMETSVPGVFAVGDGAGVAGSAMAIVEGRIAGTAAAQSLGRLAAQEALKRKKSHLNEINRIKCLRDALNRISYPRPGLFELSDNDTVICRCEELTLGDIKEAIANGSIEMNELKRMTRMGMGRCQGRMCAPVVQEIIASLTGTAAAEIQHLHQRPPIKPIPVSVLASLPGEFKIRSGW
jgi:NADPH-dependent 2,4-dienoyl-CoA reductase/sulfur reductase-like enzyme